jgi:hypothetical protein
MNGVDGVVVPFMVDLADLLGLSEHAAFAVADDGIIVPAALPELVNHLHVLVGYVVTQIVAGLLVETGALSSAFEVACDDIPTSPAFRQMVQRRHAPGKLKRRLVGKRPGDAESQMLSHIRHHGDEQKGIVDRHLCRVAQRRVG